MGLKRTNLCLTGSAMAVDLRWPTATGSFSEIEAYPDMPQLRLPVSDPLLETDTRMRCAEPAARRRRMHAIPTARWLECRYPPVAAKINVRRDEIQSSGGGVVSVRIRGTCNVPGGKEPDHAETGYSSPPLALIGILRGEG